MAVRIPWDRYEVALLFSTYERVADGADLGGEAARLSEKLRMLAIRRGNSIDETYRNVNGMKMQLANVQYLFTDGQKGLSGASAMIRQMYGLYKTNPADYQSVLKEAIRLTDSNTSVEAAFFAYAKERIGLSPGMIAEHLKKAAAYCRLNQPLLGMTDVKAVRNVQQNVAEGKLLRFRYGKDAQTIRIVTRLYYTFIKSYHEPPRKLPVQKISEEGNTISALDAFGDTEAVNVETDLGNQSLTITNAYKEDASEPNIAVLSKGAAEEQINDRLFVESNKDNSYLFTKPVSYTYRGALYAAKSWSKLYVEVCSFLFADHREAFMGIMNGDVPGYSALAFADEQNYRRMRTPKRFAPGYYLESNLDTTSIVRKICCLCQLFGLTDELKIEYRIVEGYQPAKAKSHHEIGATKPLFEDANYDWQCKDLLLVDMVSEASYAFTQPEAYEYKGVTRRVNKWGKLYIELCGALFEDHREAFMGIMNGDIPGYNALAFADEQHKNNMRTARCFAPGYYLESNIDATTIVRRIRGLYRLFNLKEQLRISYRTMQDKDRVFLEKPDADESKIGNRTTIKDAVVAVLQDAGMPLTVPEIAQRIESQNLYQFNSINPAMIIYLSIRRYCRGMKSQNHGPVDVFDRYADENGQFRYMLIGEPSKDIEDHEPSVADDRWLPILQDSFPDGYILDDFLSQFQAAGFWQERYGDICPLEGDAIDGAMKAIGTVRDGYVFARNKEESQLISAICAEIINILSQFTTVYRTCIYDRYQEKLASCQIYTEQVMSQQLLKAAKGSFYSVNQVFTKPGQYASVTQDCRKVLRDHGGPLSASEVAKVLWFIPYDTIYHSLSVDDETLNIGNSTWMLVMHFPLTYKDAQKIGEMLSEYFLANSYIQAFALMPLLQKRLPSIADNMTGMSYMAVFNAIAYYLRDQFSFSKAIIAPKGTSVDYTDLFRAFASDHETFTLADLESFSSEQKLPIYWESTFAGGAVRVNETEFVNRSLVPFDVDAVDQVLEDFCPGDYLPIQAISSAMMMHLPSCGYRWNGYLLLSYVYGFSKVFHLFCNSLGKTGFYGAMVRKKCKEIINYGSLIERVLTDDDTWTTSADALNLLVKRGYQAFKKYKGIDTVVERARKNKQMDGR